MQPTNYAIFLIVATLMAGCAEDEDISGRAQPGRLHPTPENIPADDEVADVLFVGENLENGNTSTLARRLSAARVVRTVGEAEGEPHEMIGGIGDVEASGGMLHLIDAEYAHIKSYSADGTFRSIFGRKGKGPLEFMYPEAVVQTADGRLVVADRSRNIKVFVRSDTSLTLQQTFAVDYTPNGLCVMEGRIYVQGYTAERDGIVHVYSVSGEHIRSFGKPYRSGVPFVRESLSRGKVACIEETETIVATLTNVPVLFGYGPGGEEKWRTKIGGFKPSRIVETVDDAGRQGLRYGGGTGEQDYVAALEAVPGGQALLQLLRMDVQKDRPPRLSDATVYTYLIEAEVGKGTYLGSALPAPILAVTADYLYTGYYRPFPQLTVHALAGANE